MQLYVSIRDRAGAIDETGDPWNGRTLEWATSSPPAPYNFAIVPQVEDLDAFADMKRRGVVGPPSSRYEDIVMPKSTSLGVIIGGAGFVLGFAMIWHIWWLALVALLVAAAALIIKAGDDDDEFTITAAEVETIESKRQYSQLKIATDATAAGTPPAAEQPAAGKV